jgi:hypothetical protein
MDLFERDKLPVVATVEQVRVLNGISHQPVFFNSAI